MYSIFIPDITLLPAAVVVDNSCCYVPELALFFFSELYSKCIIIIQMYVYTTNLTYCSNVISSKLNKDRVFNNIWCCRKMNEVLTFMLVIFSSYL